MSLAYLRNTMSPTKGSRGPIDPRDPHGTGSSDGGREPGRRRNPIGNPRTRFSILYFLLTILLLLGLNYVLGRQNTSQITYSEMKKRIAAGEVKKVTISSDMLEAQVADSLVKKGEPDTWTAVRVQGDTGLIPLLEKKNIDFEGKTQGWLSQGLVWLLPLGLMLVFWIWLLRRMNPAQGVMRVGKNRARIVGIEGTGVDFGDVAGADEAKQELEEVVEFLKTPEKFRRLGAKIPKGVLLVGAPGTGKTLLARAVAGEAGVTFFSINGSEFVEMFVGVGASRVRDLFEQAKSNAPCIVFIDELDALGKARGIGGVMGGNDEREQTLNQLLVEMDGFDPRTGVIIMAATNRPEILDTALLRPGRFDRQVVVDRPDVKGREAILRVHAQGKRLARDVDLRIVAQRTPGFVGADLANLLNEAALLAARRDKTEVSMSEIDEAIDRVVAGLEKKNRLINDREREIVAYHETGHAVVAERVDFADPVHKVSIVPRGIGALGYTQQLPESDRYLLQRRELLDRLAVLLGGRVAEEIVFDEISTGASNDLERASDIARRMVRQYGMSETIGPVTYEHERRSFLDRNGSAGPHLPGSEPREFSEATAETIDREVRKIVTAAHDHAERVLRGERAALDRIAHKLLKDEVIDRAELRRLLDQEPESPDKPAPDDAVARA